MPRPNTRKNPEPSEARRTNVLLEELRAEFRSFGEGLSALRSEFSSFKAALFELAEDMKLVKPAVQATTKAVQEIEKRLELAESKLST